LRLLHGAMKKPAEVDTEMPMVWHSYDTLVRGIVAWANAHLGMINETIPRGITRNCLFNMLRGTADVSSGGLQVIEIGEYVHKLYVPTV